MALFSPVLAGNVMSQAVLAHRLLKPDYTTSPLLQKERTFSVSAEIFSCAQVTQFFLVNPTDFKQSPCWQITPLKIFSRQGQEIFLRKILRSSAPLTVKNFGGINQPRGLLKKCYAFFDFVNAHLRISPKGYAQA